MEDSLGILEAKINAMIVEDMREDYGPEPHNPLLPLMLALTQEVKKLRDEIRPVPSQEAG